MSFDGIRAKRDQWRAEGLCYSCGAEAAEGHKLCEEHLRYHREYRSAAYRDKRATGRCLDCREPAVDGTTLCAQHTEDRRLAKERTVAARERMARMMATVLERRRALGICAVIRCQSAVVEGADRCLDHADPVRRRTEQNIKHSRAIRDRRLAAGLCRHCGWPVCARSRLYCEDCLQDRRDRMALLRDERRAAGLCPECGGKRRGGIICKRCRTRLNKVSRSWRDKRKAEGTCLFCKRPPLPGITICAEHRQREHDNRARRKRVQAGVVFKEAA